MKDKGFTLVELLATMVILALLILVGTMTVSNIFDNTKDNYYHSLENTLSIAGNEYFNDNREDRPIDDYNFVDMETLVNHEYMEELKTYDGKEKCNSDTGVYIYNEGNDNGYEVCLVCGEYKSEGVYCSGKKAGTIHITGNINDKNGPTYNPLLSYSGTKWINASNVWIHFNLTDEGVNVSKYTIYNANGNSFVGDCNATGNKCSRNFQSTGSYYVEAFEGNNKVGNRKYFNVKIDNTPPTMDLKNLQTEFLLDDDSIVYEYENEVINVHDDNGYKEVKYTLTRYKPTGNEYIARDKDIKDADFKIRESLQSGKYDLYITVTDFAGNKATQKNTHITFYIKYNVDLQYFDNQDNRHDVGRIKVYTYGKYSSLPGKVNVNSNPQEVSWYLNANMVGNITTNESQVEKTGYHVLYGKEAKFKSTLGAKCNNLTYNGKTQQLATIPNDEKGKYRLLVYYDNKLTANEAKDARTYTVIAMLNSEYTWADGSTKAKAIRCEILPKQVPVPTCNSPTYDGTQQKLVTTVDDSGNYAGFNETAFSLGDSPYRVNAGSYSFTAKLNSNKNYSWKSDSTNYDFNDRSLKCEIKPKRIKFDYKCCSDCVFDGAFQYLVDGFESLLIDLGVNDTQGEQPLLYEDSSVKMPTDEEYNDLWSEFYSYQAEKNEGDFAFASNSDDEYGVPVFTVNPFTATNAGTYTVDFVIRNQNYAFDDGERSKSLQCTIKPASVALKWDKIEFEYDGEEHIATLSEDSINILEGAPLDYDGAFFDTISYEITGKSSKVGEHTAKFSCLSIGELRNGCSNISFTNTSQDYKIVDTEKPTCSLSVSASGTISGTVNDNHGLHNFHLEFPDGSNSDSALDICQDGKYTKTGAPSYSTSSTGTYTLKVQDCSFNSTSCSIDVKKQKQTRSCKEGKRCNDSDCESRSYCKECGCNEWGEYGSYGGCTNVYDLGSDDDSTECTLCVNGKYNCHTRTCSKKKYCQDASCSCTQHKKDIAKCGCDTWDSWPTTWTDDNDCSAGESSNHSSETRCQYAKK